MGAALEQAEGKGRGQQQQRREPQVLPFRRLQHQPQQIRGSRVLRLSRMPAYPNCNDDAAKFDVDVCKTEPTVRPVSVSN